MSFQSSPTDNIKTLFHGNKFGMIFPIGNGVTGVLVEIENEETI